MHERERLVRGLPSAHTHTHTQTQTHTQTAAIGPGPVGGGGEGGLLSGTTKMSDSDASEAKPWRGSG